MSIYDQNRVPVMKAALSTNGTTITNIQINPTGHNLKVDDGTGGSNNSANTNDLRDGNYKTLLWATSSVDGVTPVQLYCDASGKLLINSN